MIPILNEQQYDANSNNFLNTFDSNSATSATIDTLKQPKINSNHQTILDQASSTLTNSNTKNNSNSNRFTYRVRQNQNRRHEYDEYDVDEDADEINANEHEFVDEDFVDDEHDRSNESEFNSDDVNDHTCTLNCRFCYHINMI